VNIVISAPGTGAGKTLVSQALCSALRRTGRTVQPYKIGPDYIDARFYERVAGRPDLLKTFAQTTTSSFGRG
jgi:cobyrinic acid a,c-diamide synthase